MKTWLVVVLVGMAAVLTAGVAVMGLLTVADKDGDRHGVALVLDKSELYKNQRTLTYTIVNNSPDVISFGAPYDIQIKKNGEWVQVEWMKDLVWIMILYTLEPGKSFSQTIELPKDIEPGHYRLVKEITVEKTGGKMVLTAEFEVIGS
ncbi:MAG: hypothetical protein NZ581_06670 [Candidatus Caldarchaeum sp.]|nr:hypothetical protein [Candidatus Caldarchaeum sp.]MDW8435861.1 hypothetical protein [Candidatus Caldarchaeum sp.]